MEGVRQWLQTDPGSTTRLDYDDYVEEFNAQVLSTVIRLTAQPETAVARVTAREAAGWPGLEQLRDTARDLGGSLDALVGVDRVIATDEATPAEVVVAVRDAARI